MQGRRRWLVQGDKRNVDGAGVLVVGPGRRIDDPAYTAAENYVSEGRAGNVGFVEVDRLMKVGFLALDGDVVFRFLDQGRAGCWIDPGNGDAFAFKSTIRTRRRGADGNFLTGPLDNGRTGGNADGCTQDKGRTERRVFSDRRQ